MSSTNLNSTHVISLAQAIDMTKRFRENRTSVLKTEYTGSDILPICETFDKEAFYRLFKNENCKKIRIYYGMKSNLQLHAIIIGVNSANEDMISNTATGFSVTENDDDDDDVLLEESQRCPPSCPPPSPLNEP